MLEEREEDFQKLEQRFKEQSREKAVLEEELAFSRGRIKEDNDSEDVLLALPDRLALVLEEKKTPQIHLEEKRELESRLEAALQEMSRLRAEVVEMGKHPERTNAPPSESVNTASTYGMKMIKWSLAHRVENQVREAIAQWTRHVELASRQSIFEQSNAREMAKIVFAQVMAKWFDKGTRDCYKHWRKNAAADGRKVGVRARFKRRTVANA